MNFEENKKQFIKEIERETYRNWLILYETIEKEVRQDEREHIEKEVRKLKYVVLDSSDFNAIKQDVLKIVRNEPKVKDR